jgi:hypothetical protein
MAAESQRARERRELEERVSYFFTDPPWFPSDPDRYLNAGLDLGLDIISHLKQFKFYISFFLLSSLVVSCLKRRTRVLRRNRYGTYKIISWLQLVENVRGFIIFKLGCVPLHFNANLDPDPDPAFHFNTDPDPVYRPSGAPFLSVHDPPRP